MLGTIIRPTEIDWLTQYRILAEWCNENQAMIIEQDDGSYIAVECHCTETVIDKRKEILYEYLNRLEHIKNGIVTQLAMGSDITKLQAHYKTTQQEMSKKLKEVTTQ